MSNTQTQVSIKNFFEGDAIQKKFRELLGSRAQGFITSVLQVIASNTLLQKADPVSVYQAAAVAATLDLPINNNLGFAYIVPFKTKQPDGSYKDVAQFQMGYKGFVQLAQRSGQFKTISAAPIYEGQLIEENPLTGYVFDFKQKKSDKIIGYAAYFALINGFEKVAYMTREELDKHGKKFSQTYKKGFGLWKDDFDSMASKTVLKLVLAKFAPLSIEMQKAVISDQALIKDSDRDDVEYIDHEDLTPDAVTVSRAKERQRILDHIAACTDGKELTAMNTDGFDDEMIDALNSRIDALS